MRHDALHRCIAVLVHNNSILGLLVFEIRRDSISIIFVIFYVRRKPSFPFLVDLAVVY